MIRDTSQHDAQVNVMKMAVFFFFFFLLISFPFVSMAARCTPITTETPVVRSVGCWMVSLSSLERR